MPDPLAKLMYVDDSGHQESGLVVFGWVSMSPASWRPILRRWLDVRNSLRREHGIDVDRELHATDFVNGRGRIASRIPDRYIHGGVPYWKDLGQDVALRLLGELSSLEGLSIGSAFRRLAPHPTQTVKVRLYRDLVRDWESELVRRGEFAMVFMDGNEDDHPYRTAHRQLRLDSRRIIEDPLMTDSRSSHFVQMADLVAWCAYIAVERPERHEFAWSWYDEYLSLRDPRRAPIEVSAGNSETP